MTEHVHDASILDPGTLVDLIGLARDTDDGTLSDVIAAFSREAEGRITGLQTALDEGDLATVGELAHGLRGSSTTLAARAVAECCVEIELAARVADRDALRHRMSELRTHLPAALEALKRVLGAGSTDCRMEAR